MAETGQGRASDPSDDGLLGLLADCGELLSRHSNPLNAMVEVVRKIGELLDADRMQYFVRDPSARVSQCIASWERTSSAPLPPGPYHDEDFEELILPLSRGEIYSSTVANKSGRNLEINEELGTTADVMVPVIVGGDLCGILNIDQCRGQAFFPPRQVNTLRALAAMIASTLRRSQAEDIRSQLVKEQHLAREATIESAVVVVRELLSIGDFELALDRVLPLIGDMATCQRVALLLRREVDGRACHVLVREWLAPGQASQASVDLSTVFDDMTALGAVAGLESGSPYWWRTLEQHDEFSRRYQTLGVHVCGALPLLVEGRYAGILAYGWCFEPDLGAYGVEFRVLQLAANAVAAALQRQRATERRIEQERERLEAIEFEQARHARRRAEHLEAANGVLRAINQRLADGGEPRAALQAILEQAALALGARAGTMLQFVDGKPCLVAHIGLAVIETAIPVAKSSLGSVASRLGWRAVTDRDVGESSSWRQSGITEVLEAEIFDGDHAAGVLCLGFPAPLEQKDAVEWLVEAICQQAALAMRLAALSTELEARTRQETLLAERARMAREIHDGVAQGFTGILMQLGALAEADDDLARVKDLARRAADLARQGLSDSRRAVLALQSESSGREDLISALAHLVEGARVPGRTECHFSSRGSGFDACLGPARAHDLYRVVQEALSNALRHAHAGRIDVTVSRSQSGIDLQVRDDGVGFIEVGGDGFGISNMRARVRDMGGLLRIESVPGAGTSLIVSMPSFT